MKNLIIYCHPDSNSFCHAMLETVTKTLSDRKQEMIVRDLYAMKFNPIMGEEDLALFKASKTAEDIQKEQEYIKWAELITLIYPIWWTGLPAMIKGYMDRVLSLGFAYNVSIKGVTKLLTDKKVVIFNSYATPKGIYEMLGVLDAMKKTSDIGIFDFCGIRVLEHKFFPGIMFVDDAARKGYLEEVKSFMSKC